uniref:Uncharacterized protein n=1 Tax=Cyprinus carpio TaxID=7962 RepID=A0A8C1IF91_CYPCA
MKSESKQCPSESPPNETPIEREIRLSMKREQSLRRSRGLCDTIDRTNEFVDIPVRKPILSQDPQIRPNPSHGKDRQFAGKKMQREISVETEREKVLVELGRLPGFYDKGTEVQLQDKKHLFESFQEPKESVATISRRSATVDRNHVPGAPRSHWKGNLFLKLIKQITSALLTPLFTQPLSCWTHTKKHLSFKFCCIQNIHFIRLSNACEQTHILSIASTTRYCLATREDATLRECINRGYICKEHTAYLINPKKELLI